MDNNIKNRANPNYHGDYYREMQLEKSRYEKKRITRYIPFFRFVDFLKNGLFIPNATLFEDRWEGLVALKNSLTKSNIDKNYFANIKKALSWIHVSCWYNSEKENYLMWKTYGQNNEAIRIETTKDKLLQVYKNSPYFYAAYMGEVEYRETTSEESAVKVHSFIGPIGDKIPPIYKNGKNWVDIVHIMPHLLVKYDPYHGEKELRLVCLNKDYQYYNTYPLPGIKIKLNKISDFLMGITLAPGATNEVYETTQMIVERYSPEIKDKIKKSILDI
jgi:hypothetical protein